MQIFRSLAGYSLGRADIVRRAMSKKKADVMEREKQIFLYGLTNDDGTVEVEGCIRRGVSEDVAKAIFHEMESFASYAFNKSHAAAYAMVAYQTAWLKCYYPQQYMASLLTSVLDSTNKVVSYINDCNRMNIRVLPPHINESGARFTPVGNDIRFGLLAVKNLGRGFIDRLVREREQHGRFQSFYQFCKRMYALELNRRALESLIKCGAMDGLSEGYNRNQMLSAVSQVLEVLESDRRKNVEGQIGFFDTPDDQDSQTGFTIGPMAELPVQERLAGEKEVAGLYLSGHPMAEYADLYKDRSVTKTSDLYPDSDGQCRRSDGDTVKLIGIITALKRKVTRSNAMMAFLTLEDMFGGVEVLVFPSVLNQYGALITEGRVIAVRGRVSTTEDKDPKLICDAVVPVEEHGTLLGSGQEQQNGRKQIHSKRPGLYLKVQNPDCPKYRKALQYTAIFDGMTPLYLYFTDSKKLVLAPPALRVDLNEPLVRALRELLGNENVAVVS